LKEKIQLSLFDAVFHVTSGARKLLVDDSRFIKSIQYKLAKQYYELAELGFLDRQTELLDVVLTDMEPISP
jgi:hypothetical protein